jgi:hypothetical protein
VVVAAGVLYTACSLHYAQLRVMRHAERDPKDEIRVLLPEFR